MSETKESGTAADDSGAVMDIAAKDAGAAAADAAAEDNGAAAKDAGAETEDAGAAAAAAIMGAAADDLDADDSIGLYPLRSSMAGTTKCLNVQESEFSHSPKALS